MIYIAERAIDYIGIGALQGIAVIEEPHPQFNGYLALKSVANDLYGRVEPSTGALTFGQLTPGFNEKFLKNGNLYAGVWGDPPTLNPFFFLRFES